ncbi:MAG TPA: porin family protein [Candidatus Bathyarchaeia archaeon]|nr:porin family protein [Candidatus Bathyarchaeia archaeon]
MKRTALIIVSLMLVSCAASAKGISLGFKAGVYTASTTEIPQGWGNSSFKSGFAGGVVVCDATSDWFALQPEILYVMKGLGGGYSSRFGAVTLKGKFNYIEIPVLVRYTVQTGNRVRPYLLLGPSLGISLDAKVDIEQVDPRTHATTTGSADYSNVMSKTEFGFTFGVGCACGIGRGDITLDGRFDLGLSKTFKGGDVNEVIGGRTTTTTVYAGNNKNIGFALLVGYGF